MGERVPQVKFWPIFKNTILKIATVNWGPNNMFRFPKTGATGQIWRKMAESMGEGTIQLKRPVKRIDINSKIVSVHDEDIKYDYLISSLPLPQLAAMSTGLPDDLKRKASELKYSSSHIVGIGLKGRPPASIKDIGWMYFPDPEIPYYRATILSNYSPHCVPPGEHWSLLLEVSESEYWNKGLDSVVENVELENLKDDVKYYYKVNTVDADGTEYEGTTLSFLTLPRPQVKTVRIQQIAGTAQPTVLVSWTSNTPLSSIVTYFPAASPSDAQDEVAVELVNGEHQMIIRGLAPLTPYSLVVSGRDKAGNEARSDKQNFTTATDTRPPKMTNIKIEGSTSKAAKGSDQKLAQFIVSWTTDEPATSQVEFGEGTGTTHPQKSQEDAQLKVNHLVIITNIPPSRVYHMRALSKDSAGNEAKSPDLVSISAKGNDDALDLVMTNLMESFGFLRGVVPK
jgi:hypothetical protein